MRLINRLFKSVKSAVGSLELGHGKTLKGVAHKGKKGILPRSLRLESLEDRQLLAAGGEDGDTPTVAVGATIFTAPQTTVSTSPVAVPSINAVDIVLDSQGNVISGQPVDAKTGSSVAQYPLSDIINTSTDYDRVKNGYDTAKDMMREGEDNYIKRRGVTYQQYYWMQTAAEMLWAASWAQNAGFTSIDEVQQHIMENYVPANNGYASDVIEWFITGDYTTVDDRYYDGTLNGSRKTNYNGGGFFPEVNYDAVGSYVYDPVTLNQLPGKNNKYASGTCNSSDVMEQVFLALDSHTAVSAELGWYFTKADKSFHTRIKTNDGSVYQYGTASRGDLEQNMGDSNSLVINKLYYCEGRVIGISFASSDMAIGIEADVCYLVEMDPVLGCYRFAIEWEWMENPNEVLDNYYIEKSNEVLQARREVDPLFRYWESQGGNRYTRNTTGSIRYLTGYSGAARAYHVAYWVNEGDFGTVVRDEETHEVIADTRGFQCLAITGLNFLQNYYEKISPFSLTDDYINGSAPPDPEGKGGLQSLPGSPNVIWLDPSQFDFDHNLGNLSFQEKAWLVEVWQRVSEDFAPFNVNVTIYQSVYNAAAENRVRVNVGEGICEGYKTLNADSKTYAYVVESSSVVSPSYTEFEVGLNVNIVKMIAEKASFDAASSVGVAPSRYWHSENPNGPSVYPGHGNWGPIMGNPASIAKQMTQWSHGEYDGAVSSQNQLAVLAAKFGAREDDFASSFQEAKDNADSALTMVPYAGQYGNTQMTCNVKGLIGLGVQDPDTGEFAPDDDWFSFKSYGGTYVIDVSGVGADARWRVRDKDLGNFYNEDSLNFFDWWMTNLNIRLDVYDENGNRIQSVMSTGTSFAHLAITLDPKKDEETGEVLRDAETGEVVPGTYFFRVSGVGQGNGIVDGYSAYGSLGQYTLSLSENYEDFIKFDEETGENYIVVTTLEDTIALDNKVSLREALYMLGRRLDHRVGGNEAYVGSEIRFHSSLIYNNELGREYTSEELVNGAATIHLNQELGSLMLNYQLKSPEIKSNVAGGGSVSTVINAQKYWVGDPTNIYGGYFVERTGANITIDARADDGSSSFRTVCVDNIEAELNGIIITGGNATSAADFPEASNSVDQYGGGVFNHYGWLTINNSRVSGNRALKGAGGIYNTGGYKQVYHPAESGNEYNFNDFFGYLYLVNTEISGNIATYFKDETAASFGGGIRNDLCAQITMINCTVAGNVASWSGGGIDNYGRMDIYSSIIAGNYASLGSDIYTSDDAFIGDGYTRLYSSFVGDTRFDNDSDNGDPNKNRVPWNYGQKYGRAAELDVNCILGVSSVDYVDGKRNFTNVADPQYLVFNGDWVVMGLLWNNRWDVNGLLINNGHQLFEVIDTEQTLQNWYVDLWKSWNLSVMVDSQAIGSGVVPQYADELLKMQYAKWYPIWKDNTPESWINDVKGTILSVDATAVLTSPDSLQELWQAYLGTKDTVYNDYAQAVYYQDLYDSYYNYYYDDSKNVTEGLIFDELATASNDLQFIDAEGNTKHVSVWKQFLGSSEDVNNTDTLFGALAGPRPASPPATADEIKAAVYNRFRALLFNQTNYSQAELTGLLGTSVGNASERFNDWYKTATDWRALYYKVTPARTPEETRTMNALYDSLMKKLEGRLQVPFINCDKPLSTAGLTDYVSRIDYFKFRADEQAKLLAEATIPAMAQREIDADVTGKGYFDDALVTQVEGYYDRSSRDLAVKMFKINQMQYYELAQAEKNYALDCDVRDKILGTNYTQYWLTKRLTELQEGTIASQWDNETPEDFYNFILPAETWTEGASLREYYETTTDEYNNWVWESAVTDAYNVVIGNPNNTDGNEIVIDYFNSVYGQDVGNIVQNNLSIIRAAADLGEATFKNGLVTYDLNTTFAANQATIIGNRIKYQKEIDCARWFEEQIGAGEYVVLTPVELDETPHNYHDLARGERIVNDVIDMGAYEYQLSPPPGTSIPDFTGFIPETINTPYIETDWAYPLIVGKSETDRTGIGLVVNENTYNTFLDEDRSANTIVSSETVLLDFAFFNQGSATLQGTTLTVNFDLAVAKTIEALKSGYTGGEYNPEEYNPIGYLGTAYAQTLFAFNVAGPYAGQNAELSITPGTWIVNDGATFALEGGSITIPTKGINPKRDTRAAARLFGDTNADGIVDDDEEVFGTVCFYSNGLITIENLTFEPTRQVTEADAADQLGFYQFAMYLDADKNFPEEERLDNNFYASMIRVIENPTLVVTTDQDVVDPYDNEISLREALAYASYEKREEKVLTEGTKVSAWVEVEGERVLVEYVIQDGKFYQVVPGDYYFPVATSGTEGSPLADGTPFVDGDVITIATNSIANYRAYDRLGNFLRTVPVLLEAGTTLTYSANPDQEVPYFIDADGKHYELWSHTQITMGIDTFYYADENLVSANFVAGDVLAAVYESWNALYDEGRTTLQTVQTGYFRVAGDVATPLVNDDEVEVTVDGTNPGLCLVRSGQPKTPVAYGVYQLTYSNGYFTDSDGNLYLMDEGTSFAFEGDTYTYSEAIETDVEPANYSKYTLFVSANPVPYTWSVDDNNWVDTEGNVLVLSADTHYTLVAISDQTGDNIRVEFKSGVTINVVDVLGSDIYFAEDAFGHDQMVTITLDADKGALPVNKSVTIHAECRWDSNSDEVIFDGESEKIIVDGGTLYDPVDGTIMTEGVQVFNIVAGENSLFNNLTIRNGLAENGGGIATAEGTGLVLIDCLVENNRALSSGGGIYALGTLDMFNTSILSNSVTTTVSEFQATKYFYGGGIYLGNIETASITGGEFSGNKIDITTDGAVNTTVHVYGGGIYTVSSLTITDTNFDNNTISVTDRDDSTTSIGDGGAIWASGDLTLEAGKTIQGNAAIDRGGAFYVGGNMTLTATTVSDNATERGSGGAFYVVGAATMAGTEFRANLAGTQRVEGNDPAAYGGVLYAGGEVVLNVVQDADDEVLETLFVGNQAWGGGAIYVEQGGLTVVELSVVKFENNEAGGSGGALYVLDEVLLEGATSFSGNNALNGDGGAIWTSSDLTLTNGTTINNNMATDRGGAAYVGGNMTLTAATVSGNETETGSGGAFYVGGWAEVEVSGHNFDENKAGTTAGSEAHGGFLYAMGNVAVNVTAEAQGADWPSISRNTASANGGAIYVDQGILNFTALSSVDFNGNEAGGSGGALYVRDKILLEGEISFTGNNALDGSGGAIWTSSDVDLKNGASIQNNRATDQGGAFYVGGDLTLTATIVSENETETGHGGAFYVGGTAAMAGTEFSGNKAGTQRAADTAPAHGGVLYAGSNVVLNAVVQGEGAAAVVLETLFTDNQAWGGSGGAIYVEQGGLTVVEQSSVEFSENEAGGSGGALYVRDKILLAGTTSFNLNKVLSGDGGAIWTSSDLALANGTTIQGNTATHRGGAAYVGGDMILTATTVSDNITETGHGGAFYVVGTAAMAGTGFSGNKAGTLRAVDAVPAHGGVLYAGGNVVLDVVVQGEGADAVVLETLFSGNQAWGGSGGAIYVDQGDLSFVAQSNVKFENNEAGMLSVEADASKEPTANGGAICVVEGSLTVDNVESNEVVQSNVDFEGNKAGGSGGAAYVGGNMTLIATTISANETETGHGGAFYVAGRAEVTGRNFDDNKAGTTAGSEAHGGFLYAMGNVVISVAAEVEGEVLPSISGNMASADGGAIYVDQGALNLTALSSVDINGNEAGGSGGALYTFEKITLEGAISFTGNKALAGSGGAIWTASDVDLKNGAEIKANTATDQGGAFYVGGDLKLTAATVSENETETGHGGAFYVAGWAEVTGRNFDANQAGTTAGSEAHGGFLYARNEVILNVMAAEEDEEEEPLSISGNSASGCGGALYILDDVILDSETLFTTNNASGGDGGAIWTSGDLTLISGTMENNVAFGQGGAAYVDGNAFLSSLTVSDNETNTGDGGALYVKGTAHLLSVEFRGNTAGTTDGETAHGGALYAAGDVTLDGVSRFISNTASGNGGAICVTPGTLSLTAQSNVEFSNNEAVDSGGALYISNNVNLAGGATFTLNKAWSGDGGAICVDQGELNLAEQSSFHFTSNVAGHDGGAICLPGNIDISRNVIVNDNTAQNSGGGIYSQGKVAIIDTSVYANTAIDGDGGAVRANDIVVVNSEIFGNFAANGGALWANDSLKLTNATITQNIATTGGGLFVASETASTTINNSIIAINHAGEANVNNDPTNDVKVSGTYTIAYSLIGVGEGLADATGTASYYYKGTADVPFDPRFETDFFWNTQGETWSTIINAPGQLALDSSSVGINNGKNDLAVYEDGSEIESDLLGNPRIYTGGKIHFVDLGAYEFQAYSEDEPDVKCDLAFFEEGTIETGTTRTGVDGPWSKPVILSIAVEGDPLTPPAIEITSDDKLFIGVSFFNAETGVASVGKQFSVTIECYRKNNDEWKLYGDSQVVTVGDEVYSLAPGESDYINYEWTSKLTPGDYYFKVELNSPETESFLEVTRDNNIYGDENATHVKVRRDTTIVVNTVEDYALDGDGEYLMDQKVSLREALEILTTPEYKDDPNTEEIRIRFDESIAGQTIILTPELGQLNVQRSVYIAGTDVEGNDLNITIDGGDQVRIFNIVDYHDGIHNDEDSTQGLIATIENLTLINGNATTSFVMDDPNDEVKASGGAIASAARGTADQYGLTLRNVTMKDNKGVSGGAVKNVGKMKIENCTITGNKTINDGRGAGIYNGGELYITHSQISGNESVKYGGGIASFGLSEFTEATSTVSYGKLEVYNSLISGNTATHGGGILLLPSQPLNPASKPVITLGNVTIVGNQATTQGGGLWVSRRADLTVTNSIIYGNVCTASASTNNVYFENSAAMAGAMDNSIYATDSPEINFASYTLGSSYTGWKNWDLRIGEGGDTNVVDQGRELPIAEESVSDLNGNGRVNGTAVDLGAYEWYADYLTISTTEYTLPVGTSSVPEGTEIATLSTQLVNAIGVTYTTESEDFLIEGDKLVAKKELFASDSPIAVIVTATQADGSTYDMQTWDITLKLAPVATPSVASTHQVSGDDVFLTWSAVEDATGFRVRYKLIDGTQWTYANDICYGTSGIVRGAFTVGQTYVFQVQAIGGAYSSDSQWSGAEQTMLRSMAAASYAAGGNVDLRGWSAKQCVTIEYRTPSFETKLSDLLDGQVVKFSAKVENTRSISVIGWAINWGDGATTNISGRFNSISSAHYYQTAGTYCISVSLIDSQGAGNGIWYYVGSHTFEQPVGQPDNSVVQEVAVPAESIEEELVETPVDLVTGSTAPVVAMNTVDLVPVDWVACVDSTKLLEPKAFQAAPPRTGYATGTAAFESDSRFARRARTISQFVQNLHAVKTDRFFATLSDNDDLNSGVDYGFESVLEMNQTESVYDEVLDELNI